MIWSKRLRAVSVYCHLTGESPSELSVKLFFCGAVADPPSSRISSPPVSHRDAMNSHSSRTPWRREKSVCARHNSPNKPRDTTVSRLSDSVRSRAPGLAAPPLSLCAGRAVHMDVSGARRQQWRRLLQLQVMLHGRT